MDVEVVPKLTVKFQRTFTFLIESRVCYSSKILIDDPEKEDSPPFFCLHGGFYPNISKYLTQINSHFRPFNNLNED